MSGGSSSSTPLPSPVRLLPLLAVAASSYVQLRTADIRPHGRSSAASACRMAAPTAAAPDTTAFEDTWLEHAVDAAAPLRAASPSLDALRADAADALRDLTFPGRKVEAWRRFDLSALKAARLTEPPQGGVDAAALIDECMDETTAGRRLVLVDGVCDPALSDLSALPEGVTVGSLTSVSGGADAAVRSALSSLPETGADMRTALGSYTFAALNQASLGDVACVYVPEGVQVEVSRTAAQQQQRTRKPSPPLLTTSLHPCATQEPIHVLMLSSGSIEAAEASSSGEEEVEEESGVIVSRSSSRPAAAPAVLPASHPSLVISLAAGASARVLQQYAGRGAYWTNAVTRVVLEEGSSLEHSYVQVCAAAATARPVSEASTATAAAAAQQQPQAHPTHHCTPCLLCRV